MTLPILSLDECSANPVIPTGSKGNYCFVMVSANAVQEVHSMMTIQRVAHYVGAELFRPFRINMASGKFYEIRHPEMVQVGRSTVTIFTYLSDKPEEAKEREQEVSLLLIKSIEPLDVSAAKDGKS